MPKTVPKTILITGANRGLGLELTRQYLNDQNRVIATARTPANAENLQQLQQSFPDQLTVYPLDVTKQESIHSLSASLQGQPLDMLINNAGIYGPREMTVSPDNLDMATWQEVLTTNTISPLLISAALLPSLKAGQGKTIIFISSFYGSIASNTATTGSYYYASSKAAMNMTVKKLSDELASEGFICTSISPGWVQTDMGGPEADLTVEESITRVRSVIEKLKSADNGGFLNSLGETLPW
ncbi:SDR family oxidoreductase [Parendozoicomonas haliclonae]|uniref:C-factor n=1 Tax=Parendozoicomonas haliclonae TaxID=1960125 RepID=A0A1X7AP13_9GAMM|nr:SDR family oxidoreductase [Parendozoicomonas haliclonae]SMA50044.1 C-factor [Parendozoicomonas haliclonae]